MSDFLSFWWMWAWHSGTAMADACWLDCQTYSLPQFALRPAQFLLYDAGTSMQAVGTTRSLPVSR
jgi:hypothetical protein